ncbi:MAG TPA: AAA family ATPase [Acidobacteriota bacterium]|jgi:type II secretory pathway predicted ATPase ExeA|nr:AAA family ATPase [Acidobacteriota bacterium]
MYLEHWGLKEKPFENTPDPKFLYLSAEHRECLKRMLYALTDHKGCALLTGEYGCGKTVLVRTVVESLDPNRYELALINYPIFVAGEFLREILNQFGVEPKPGTRLEVFHQISDYAFDNVKKGKQNLVVIDEAQLIEDPQVFDEVRLLLNMQLEDRFLNTIFLVGQPELRERVMQYPQLEQRIGVKYHLHRFGDEDTVGYIRHRLKIAGATREIFTPESYYLIFKISYGVPRRINNLCDLCLLEGASSDAKSIDDSVIKKIL